MSRCTAACRRTQQRKLEDGTRIILAEKDWEGVQGLALTDEIKVTIAGMASLLVLGFHRDYYPNVETIIVYPQGFLVTDAANGNARRFCRSRSATVRAGGFARAGHRFLGRRAGGHCGQRRQNVVLHEFAHKLDMRDGAADGAPYLDSKAQIEQWSRVMSAEYQQLGRARRRPASAAF